MHALRATAAHDASATTPDASPASNLIAPPPRGLAERRHPNVRRAPRGVCSAPVSTDAVRFGRYRVERRLGAGGMGVVHLAEDEVLHRRVALKVLPEDVQRSPERRERFLREARAAAAISHPNVATVFDVGETDQGLFVAMELVPGCTLREHLGKGRLPLAEVLRLARDIASAVAAAHARGLLHRDLKPENVMIEPDGRAKVLDFGLAKFIASRATSDAATLPLDGVATTEGVMLGSPGYMAPEQVMGRAVDRRVDVFALGVIMHEMIGGRSPFARDTAMASAFAAVTEEPASLSGAAPPSLVALVERCLSKDAVGRPADGREVMDALTEIVASSTSSAANAPALGSERVISTRPGDLSSASGVDPRATPALATPERAPAPTGPTATAQVIDALTPVAVMGARALVERMQPKPPPRRWPVAMSLLASAVLGLVWFGSRQPPAPTHSPPLTMPGALPGAVPSAPSTPPSTEVVVHPCEGTCAEGERTWCDEREHAIACCGDGLVPDGSDGICVCPLGGTFAAAAIAEGCTEAVGPTGLDRDAIRAGIHTDLPRIRECYEAALRVNPTMDGHFTLAFQITPSGRTRAVHLAASALPDASAQRCVIAIVRTMEFPPPRGGMPVDVSYPLTFTFAD